MTLQVSLRTQEAHAYGRLGKFKGRRWLGATPWTMITGSVSCTWVASTTAKPIEQCHYDLTLDHINENHSTENFKGGLVVTTKSLLYWSSWFWPWLFISCGFYNLCSSIDKHGRLGLWLGGSSAWLSSTGLQIRSSERAIFTLLVA